MADDTRLWRPSVTQPNERPRPLESAQCSLCGIVLPKGLMMPDGGYACDDVRWYCKDSKSCTERWTAHPPRPARTAPALEAPPVREPRADASAAGEPRAGAPALEGAAAETVEPRQAGPSRPAGVSAGQRGGRPKDAR